VKILDVLEADGIDVAQIYNQSPCMETAAEKIGVGRMTLQRWLVEKGIPRKPRTGKPPLNHYKIVAIRRMYRDGVSVRTIRSALNVSLCSIYSYVEPNRKGIWNE